MSDKTELELYRRIGSVEDFRKAMHFYREQHKPLHLPEHNCKTCYYHGSCKAEEHACWCIHFKKRI